MSAAVALWMGLVLLQAGPASQQGMKALEEQRYDQAAELFGKAVAADPKDYAAQFHLGLALSLLNRDAEAVGAYRKVLELKPGLYEAELNLGILLVRMKQPKEAAAHLEAAAQQKPKEFRPALYAGQARLDATQPAEAEAYFRRALELDAKSGEAMLGLGRSLAYQKKLADADPYFRQAAASSAEMRNALLELADLYTFEKQRDKAIEIFEQFPDNMAALERAGELYLEMGKFEEAIPRLEAAVGKEPTSANRFALATAYLGKKDYGKAEPLLAQAAAQEPQNPQLRLIYGRVLRDQRKFPAAANQFFAVTKMQADSAEAWSELAGVLILMAAPPAEAPRNASEADLKAAAKQRMEYDQIALAALDKVRSLNAEKPAHHYFRAILLDRNKQAVGALASYKRFLELSNGERPDEEFKARQRVRILEKEAKR